MKECPRCHRCFDDAAHTCPDDGSALESTLAGDPTLGGKVRLLRLIGSGGMGRVYLARHLGLQRLVAVKVLQPRYRDHELLLSRFEREAEALGRLAHPRVVDVHDYGIDAEQGSPYLVMEHLEGLSLAALLQSGGPLSVATAIDVFSQVAEAVDAAHAAGVLHRDLKPSNVFLLDGDGEAPRVKVLDFGLARFSAEAEDTPSVPGETPPDDLAPVPAAGSPLTAPGTFPGTLGYLAPELLEREAPSRASDVYAFGVLLYVALTGRKPFAGSELELTEATLHGDPPLPSRLRPGLDPALDAPLLAPLARDRRRRPASAGAVVAGLRRAAARAEARAWRRREVPRRLALAAALGAAGLLLASGLEPPLRGLELAAVDARFLLATPREPVQPLAVVLIDDASLEADPTPLSERADELGRRLRGAFDVGAAGVGIDLLLPEPWGRSPELSSLFLHHTDSVVLAAFSPPEGEVLGPEVIDRLTAAALGPDRLEGLFGYVNLDEDVDGTVRRGRVAFRDVEGRIRPSFAHRAVCVLVDCGGETPPEEGRFWIDFTIDWRRLERISWRDLESLLERAPERLRGRFLVVGASYAASGDELYRVPHPRSLPGEISGPVLQALAIHTLLDARPLRSPPAWLPAASAALGAFLAAAVGLLARPVGLALAPGLVLAAAWCVAALLAFSTAGLVLPVAPVVGTLLLITAAAAFLRRRLSPIPDPPAEDSHEATS